MAQNRIPPQERSPGVQFVQGGPIIPVELLQALEDGKLVLFCGAGISRCCGLPDFKTLVTDVTNYLGFSLELDEQDFFNREAYDTALGLIEKRIGRKRLRQAVGEVLKIKAGADLATHEALLHLARSKEGRVRLVTTNFDEGFEFAGRAGELEFAYAPSLPLPGATWSSIVHLHGGLGDPKNTDGQRLVFTSADFGRAYLTEGWAAKFLAELFRRSAAILFVGYSVSDPVIRYLVDAFAADRADEGAQTATAYILAGSTEEEIVNVERTWRSRGLVPLTYEIRNGGHHLLHETLRNCAKRYRLGLFDRTSIILEYGTYSSLLEIEKASLSQFAWALQDPSGYSARFFARLDPSPSVEWLEFLTREGVLYFESSERQSPVSWIPLNDTQDRLPPIVGGLCEWLVKKLAEPTLLLWVISHGSHLHPEFARLIRLKLAERNVALLPRGAERMWRLLSVPNAPIHSRKASNAVLTNLQLIQKDSWDPILRQFVLSGLTATISVKAPSPLNNSEEFDPNNVECYANIELTPASGGHSWQIAEKLLNRQDVGDLALNFIAWLTQQLYQGLEYLAFLDLIDTDSDRSYISRPSIDDHSQNNRFEDWTVYIYLLRELWCQVSKKEPHRARTEIAFWENIPYPIFRRLVFWSVGKAGGLSAEEYVEYIVRQPPSAVWGLDTRREFLRSLARIAPNLSGDGTEALCNLFLAGPPQSLYRLKLTVDQLKDLNEQAIRVRLLKLQENGSRMPTNAKDWLAEVNQKHPEWPNSTSERDEFPVWFEGLKWVGGQEFEEKLDDYLKWSNEEVLDDLQVVPFSIETVKRWRGLLSEDALKAAQVLEILARENRFDSELWAPALRSLGADDTQSTCVRLYATYGAKLGQTFLAKHVHVLTSVLYQYATAKDREDEGLFKLWDLLLSSAEAVEVKNSSNPIFAALNSPIGHLTDVLLIVISKISPEAYEDIPVDLRARLEHLLEGALPAHRYARALIARATAWLFRMDPGMATSFLERFDWRKSPEAREMWIGYLQSPGFSPEFWLALKPMFLETIPHSIKLGDSEQQFYWLFARILLTPDIALDAITAREGLKNGTSAGRRYVVEYWWRSADSADARGEILYRDRLRYLLTMVWPLEVELHDVEVSINLVRLAIACGAAFPDAVETIKPLLTKAEALFDVTWALKDKDHPERFPDATLMLVDAIASGQIDELSWPDLRAILNRLSNTKPSLRADPGFVRLNTLLRPFE